MSGEGYAGCSCCPNKFPHNELLSSLQQWVAKGAIIFALISMLWLLKITNFVGISLFDTCAEAITVVFLGIWALGPPRFFSLNFIILAIAQMSASTGVKLYLSFKRFPVLIGRVCLRFILRVWSKAMSSKIRLMLGNVHQSLYAQQRTVK